MPDSKIARVAYLAYARASGTALPAWESLMPVERAAWLSAVTAVLNEVDGGSLPSTDPAPAGYPGLSS